MCLFDALVGNHDRHGRNIALIETRKGHILSPFYDNPSYIGIEDHNLLLAEHNPLK
jgi:serine/threonine protein kinase HipA of HipAB toxin-antitoxin module